MKHEHMTEEHLEAIQRYCKGEGPTCRRTHYEDMQDLLAEIELLRQERDYLVGRLVDMSRAVFADLPALQTVFTRHSMLELVREKLERQNA